METIVVIMLKDKETGFLDKELCSLSITENEEYIMTVFVSEDEGKNRLHLRLSTERDLKDWEYDAVFDYYDTECFKGIADTVYEVDDCYNPVWELVLDYSDDPWQTEQTVADILRLHRNELEDVYKVIADKESEYENE